MSTSTHNTCAPPPFAISFCVANCIPFWKSVRIPSHPARYPRGQSKFYLYRTLTLPLLFLSRVILSIGLAYMRTYNIARSCARRGVKSDLFIRTTCFFSRSRNRPRRMRSSFFKYPTVTSPVVIHSTGSIAYECTYGHSLAALRH